MNRNAGKSSEISVVKIGGNSLLQSAKRETLHDAAKRIAKIIKSLHQTHGKVVCVLSAFAKDTNQLYGHASQVTASPDPHSLDFYVTTGEHKSVGLISIALNDLKVKTLPMSAHNAGIITDGRPGKAAITSVSTSIQGMLHNYDVILVTGFQGISNQKHLNALGRGGSDTSAIAISIALKATRTIFLKDVKGIFSFDPKNEIGIGCTQYRKISHDLMLEQTNAGSAIIAARAAELARNYDLDYEIRSINQPTVCSTTITNNIDKKTRYCIVKNDKATLIILGPLKNVPGVLHSISNISRKLGVKLNFFNQALYPKFESTSVSFLCMDDEKDILDNMANEIRDQLQTKIIRHNHVCAVSIIGEHMFNKTGIAFDLLESLESSGLDVYSISSSEKRMTVVVPTKSADLAVKAFDSVAKEATNG